MFVSSECYDFLKNVYNATLSPIQYAKLVEKEIKILAESGNIGRLSIKVNLPPSAFEKGTEIEKTVLFEKKPDLTVEPVISEFTTFENGIYFFEIFPQKDTQWTKEDRNQVDFLAHLLFVLFTRCNLSKLIQRAQQTDILTGCLNSKGFYTLGTSIIKKRLMSKFSVIYLNIKSFKKINEKYSQEAGDIFLIKLSSKLSAFLKKDGAISRFGADKFCILIKNSRLADLLKFMKTIIIPLEIENPNGNINVTLECNLTAGISKGDNNINNIEPYIDMAQTALKSTENPDSEPFIFYNSSMENLISL